MNKSTITKLNNKYNINIDSPTLQHLSGQSYKMAFDIYADGNNSIGVVVKANEPIYKAIERSLERLNEHRLRYGHGENK